jgi:drug/metabolite transporter (DMT)-like permease
MSETTATRASANRDAIIAWFGLLVFETLAQVALKVAGNALAQHPFGVTWLEAALSNPWVLAGILGYLGSFAAWMVLLNRLPLSLGFPLTSIVMLSVVLASCLFFGETITPGRMIGIGLIIAGVTLTGRGDP